MDWNERQAKWHKEKYHSNLDESRAKARENYYKQKYKDTLTYGALAIEVDKFLKAADIIIRENPTVMDELLERLVFRMRI
jgi:hypothetical protein